MADKTPSEKLQETVKNAEVSVDASQIEKTANEAENALKNSLETTVGSIAGQIEGGVKNLTQKFDKYQEKLNNLTTEGLLDEGIQSLENMATDFVGEQVGGLLSKFGSKVNVTFSEPDEYGVVVPIDASLDAEGGISGTVAGVLQLITGLGIDAGALQKAVVEGSPKGVLDAGKDLLSGKMGAFDGAAQIKSLTETSITSVTDELENTVKSALAANSNINSVVSAIVSVDTDGTGGLILNREDVTSNRIISGNTDSAEFDTAIEKTKTNPLKDLDNIVTDSKNIKQNLDRAKSDLENLSGGKDPDEVLKSSTQSTQTRAEYTRQGDEYRSLIKTRVAKNSETGIVQGLSTETLSEVKKDVRAFAPNLTSEQVTSVINLSQGSAEDISKAIRILYDATGKAFDTIRQFVKSIDTTITTATRLKPDEIVFSEPYVIGEFAKLWNKGENNPIFPYVSSVEELQAELRNIDREVTEVVVHWSETHTNKNIGSEEINKIHLELGLEGIGYHYVIRRDGSLQRGRPVNIKGQHAPVNNHDERSVGIVFVGGINVPTGTPNSENFLSAQSLTRSQINTFDHFCRAFYAVFPGAQIVGHSEIDEDEIDPGFEVINYVENVFGKKSKFEDPFSQKPFTINEILEK